MANSADFIVEDPSGAPLAGVEVTFHADGAVHSTVTSDAAGTANDDTLPDCNLTVSAHDTLGRFPDQWFTRAASAGTATVTALNVNSPGISGGFSLYPDKLDWVPPRVRIRDSSLAPGEKVELLHNGTDLVAQYVVPAGQPLASVGEDLFRTADDTAVAGWIPPGSYLVRFTQGTKITEYSTTVDPHASMTSAVLSDSGKDFLLDGKTVAQRGPATARSGLYSHVSLGNNSYADFYDVTWAGGTPPSDPGMLVDITSLVAVPGRAVEVEVSIVEQGDYANTFDVQHVNQLQNWGAYQDIGSWDRKWWDNGGSGPLPAGVYSLMVRQNYLQTYAPLSLDLSAITGMAQGAGGGGGARNDHKIKQLLHVGFNPRQALLFESAPASPTFRELLLTGMSPRQARTWLRGDHSLEALIGGGFTKAQATVLTES